MNELGAVIRRKRQDEKRTQVELGQLLRINPSTISRIENGLGEPETATLCKLSSWLGGEFNRLTAEPKPGQVIYLPTDSTPNIIAAHILADQNLEPEAAKMLACLFRAMYEQMTEAKA